MSEMPGSRPALRPSRADEGKVVTDTKGGLIPRNHPEGTCQDCGGPNVCWHAPNELWNAVVGDERGLVLCPLCFIVRADALCLDATGKLPTGWRLTIEDPHGEFGHAGGGL